MNRASEVLANVCAGNEHAAPTEAIESRAPAHAFIGTRRLGGHDDLERL